MSVKIDDSTIPTLELPIEDTQKSHTIDAIAIKTAQDTLEKYIAGKSELDKRIIANEDWWKLQHWKKFHANKREREEMSTSAWLFNSIANKHADAMDNYPTPVVLPREASDEGTAKMLSSVLPAIFENSDFEKVYSENWWDKLKNGTAVYAVMWDQDMDHGEGNIRISAVDLLSFYWEPGVQDIQDSKNVFVLSLQDNDNLIAQYPQLQGKLSSNVVDKKQYHYDDEVDTTNKSVVVDWYYKVKTETGSIVHYVKYCGSEVLFASENEPEYEDGIYNHGEYPFIMDVLYPEKGTPAGFGIIDTEQSAQEYIDRLGAAILLNAEEGARRRYWVKDQMAVNEDEFNNIHNRLVHVAGSPGDDNIVPLEVPSLDSTYLAVLQDKVNELKETSSNRDFNQGGTASGVTAASAITALQEAGNKTSRDIIKGSYRVYTEICKMAIELIRQFYDTSRTFRITGDGGNPQYVSLNNSSLQGGTQSIAGQDFQTKEPVFDVDPKAQKENPYTTMSQNELALQFYDKGFFNPQLAEQALQCIDMMDFDGKEKVRQGIQNNSMMYQQLQQLQQVAQLSAQALAANGDTRVLEAMQSMGLAAVPEGAANDNGADQAQPVAGGNNNAGARGVQPGQ